MKKYLFPMIFLLAASLFTACDGRILTDVANSTEKVDKVYRNIIGVVNDGSTDYVYYQLNSGIYRNVSGGGSEEQLVANSQNNIVQGSALVSISSTQYILYNTNNPEEQQNGTLHLLELDGTTSTAAQLVFDDSDSNHETVAVYANGSVLVRSGGEDNSSSTYTLYYGTITTAGSGTEPTISFVSNQKITLTNGYSYQNGLDALYLQTGVTSQTKAILSFSQQNTAGSDTDYSYKYYLIDFSSTDTTTTISSSNDIGDLDDYQLAGFTVDESDNIYAITTGGRLYKKASTSGSFSYCESLGYSYEPNAAFMYRIYAGSTNYLITKRSTKNSALVVYSFADGVDSFSSTTVRYGYAQKISKDLITSAYLMTGTTLTDPNKSKLLVATNESGMVSITINNSSAASNSTSGTNGATSDYEEYVLDGYDN